MTTTAPSPLFRLKLAGLFTGLVLVAGLVVLLRVPQADGRLGADVRIVATPPAGLSTPAAGAFLAGRQL
jgi:hypothetical protein